MKKLICHAVFLACIIAGPISAAERVKVLTVDDLFSLEELGDVALSPNGKWISFVLTRPAAETHNVNRTFLIGNDRADIWLVSTDGGRPVNLTKGSTDGRGFWNPVWSPDSERLAVLSTRGGNAGLWIIDISSGRLTKATERGVATWESLFASPFLWLSNNAIACAVLPAGVTSRMTTAERQTAEAAFKEWSKAWAGMETTASSLDSGVPSDYQKRPKGALLFIDLSKGTNIAINGNFTSLSLSPDKKYLAALETVDVIQPMPQQPLVATAYEQLQLSVFSHEGKQLAIRKAPVNLKANSIRWSPDETKLVVTARDERLALYEYSVGGETLKRIDVGELLLPPNSRDTAQIPTAWSKSGGLIVRAVTKPSSSTATEAKPRSDWWLIEKGKALNLTSSMKNPPAQLIREGDSLLGVVDGGLWRLFVNRSAPVKIETDPTVRLVSLAGLSGDTESGKVIRLLVNGEKTGRSDLYELDLRSTKTELLDKPDPGAKLAGYDQEKGQAVFTANSKEGTYLWLVHPDSPPVTVIETNTFLKNIGEAEARKIEYKGLDGQTLTGWLMLPLGYHTGHRYPMIVWVYAGWMASDRPDLMPGINFNSMLNVQLLAAKGYAVLMPSMPLKPESVASDPLLELTKGVLPAVERAIELGYVDPNRLAVMGHSYGGYSTYGLVTQTNRFKAAISLAGPSDLVSIYGTFFSTDRYEPFPPRFWAAGLAETGTLRMGSPPWKDWGRFLRNSPIFYVDRVETPLMIVQGDMDQVPIQQGEEFFTALYRQGKRAKFIRYWGESHGLDSEANIRDFYNQAYAWFDEFCDISRDDKGNLIFDGDHVKSRNGRPPLKPEDFTRFNEMELKSHLWVKMQ